MKKVDLESMQAGDGSLPGGLTPEAMRRLTENPEVAEARMLLHSLCSANLIFVKTQVMRQLANPKLQEVMKAMMTAGIAKIRTMLPILFYFMIVGIMSSVSGLRQIYPHFISRIRLRAERSH